MAEPQAVSEVDLEAFRVQVEGLDAKKNKIGSGAYGIVYEVTVNGKKCIAKKLHTILIHYVRHYPKGQDDSIVKKFHQECRIMSQLKHPNVVGFVGVHYNGRDKSNISLIMEKLYCDLAEFVKKNPLAPLCDRLHILYDVSEGLDYLHSQSPPLIHRDLTAPNILLTEDLRAKIGDLGVSRYVDPSSAGKLTTTPGNLYYMPPECRIANPRYTTKLDVFSFGTLTVHTVIGDVPDVHDIPLSDPKLVQYIQSKSTELMRRDHAVHKQMGDSHCLYPLVVRCLHDESEQRPTVGELKSFFRELCIKHPKPKMTFLEACKTGNVEVVEELLASGTDPNQADKKNRTAPLWASFRGHAKVVRALIQAGAAVDTPDKDGWTALHVASQNGNCEIAGLLIKANAGVNMQNKANSTALHLTCMNGHDEVLRLLLAANAIVNIQNKWEESPLWLASCIGHQKCAQLLIDAGANVDVPKEDGSTALHAASGKGHHEVVRMLLEAKADTEMRNDGGFTALHVACDKSQLKVAETLTMAHATVSAQSKFNTTPLMCAAMDGSCSIVELLLSMGADINLRDNYGNTAYDLAHENGHTEACQKLYTF